LIALSAQRSEMAYAVKAKRYLKIFNQMEAIKVFY
jgi:hypothetical protein